MRGGLTRPDLAAMHYVFPTLGGALFAAMWGLTGRRAGGGLAEDRPVVPVRPRRTAASRREASASMMPHRSKNPARDCQLDDTESPRGKEGRPRSAVV